MNPKQIIQQALSLMHSMILCGEEHSPESYALFQKALDETNKLPDQVTPQG
jgi:hypothetical protein